VLITKRNARQAAGLGTMTADTATQSRPLPVADKSEMTRDTGPPNIHNCE